MVHLLAVAGIFLRDKYAAQQIVCNHGDVRVDRFAPLGRIGGIQAMMIGFDHIGVQHIAPALDHICFTRAV